MTLADILRELEIDRREWGTHHHTSRGREQIDCPWCSPRSGRFRMGVRLGSMASCWTCSFHPLVETLVEASGRPWREVRSLIGDADALPRTDDTRKRGRLRLPDGLGPLLPAHDDYLRGRGFDPRELERLWGIRGIGPAAKLAWRIFIPITQDGRTVSWTTRKIAAGDDRKYWNASPDQEEISAKQVLFGADRAGHSVTVHEGYLDAVAVGPGALGTGGLVVTRSQLLAIVSFPRRAICFDSEPDAQRRAEKLCRDLEPFPGVTINVVLETGKDAAEADKKEIKKLRRRFLE